jgi:2-polyprenyl-3-methyl-5-hydroxy-6-metoxy-1,4-benzoquinol methylase
MPTLQAGETPMIQEFYDRLAPYYHLIFPDWEASIQRQAAALDGIIREHWGDVRMSILDLACGIGTQALGLASLGHTVTASDVSPIAVERPSRRRRSARSASISRLPICGQRLRITASNSTS